MNQEFLDRNYLMLYEDLPTFLIKKKIRPSLVLILPLSLSPVCDSLVILIEFSRIPWGMICVLKSALGSADINNRKFSCAVSNIRSNFLSNTDNQCRTK